MVVRISSRLGRERTRSSSAPPHSYLCFPEAPNAPSRSDHLDRHALDASPLAQSCGSDVIYFAGPDLDFLVVSDVARVEDEVVRRLFKQATYAAFSRQLNVGPASLLPCIC